MTNEVQTEDPKLTEYKRRLAVHDWTACMSDDYSVAKRADQDMTEIRSMAKAVDPDMALYNEAHKKAWKL